MIEIEAHAQRRAVLVRVGGGCETHLDPITPGLGVVLLLLVRSRCRGLLRKVLLVVLHLRRQDHLLVLADRGGGTGAAARGRAAHRGGAAGGAAAPTASPSRTAAASGWAGAVGAGEERRVRRVQDGHHLAGGL